MVGALDDLTRLQMQDEVIKIREVEQITTVLARPLGGTIAACSGSPARALRTMKKARAEGRCFCGPVIASVGILLRRANCR